MKILSFKHIPGPNIYNHRPVMTMTIDLEERIAVESSQLPEFVLRSCRLCPAFTSTGALAATQGGSLNA